MSGIPKGVATFTEQKLVEILEQARNAYYDLDSKEKLKLKDEEYDFLIDLLKEKYPNSEYLFQVGHPPEGEKQILKYPLYSLNKLNYEEEDVLNRYIKKFEKMDDSVVITTKIDGFSAMLSYSQSERDKTRNLASRGDGQVGENISKCIPFIPDIPAWSPSLAGKSFRGEIVISKENFKHFDKANRNVVSGLLRRKDSFNPEDLKYVNFVAYDILSDRMKKTQMLKFLKKHGFTTPSAYSLSLEELNMDILEEIFTEECNESPYELDGLVITSNGINPLEEDGNPSYEIAWKSKTKTAKAEVDSVRWECSKDGVLVPVILLKNPVYLYGANISRVTMYNAKFLIDNDIGSGSEILITRSGQVIPKFIATLKGTFNPERDLPDPKIHSDWIWSESKVNIEVKDKEKLSGYRVKQIINFVKKMELKQIAAATVRALYDNGVDSISKFINISQKQLLNIEGIGSRKILNILENVALLREKTFLDYLVSSNQFGRGFGNRRLKPLLTAFPNIQKDSGFYPSVKDIVNLPGFSDITANLFIEGLIKFNEWIQDNELEFIRDLKSVKVAFFRPSTSSENEGGSIVYPSLEGKNIVFTLVRDKELEDAITERGGLIKSGVSGKTDILITSNDGKSSSSVEKAKQNPHTEIIDIISFRKKFGF